MKTFKVKQIGFSSFVKACILGFYPPLFLLILLISFLVLFQNPINPEPNQLYGIRGFIYGVIFSFIGPILFGLVYGTIIGVGLKIYMKFRSIKLDLELESDENP